ncbi:hypothetical protein EJ04DRAFT_555137 [Polyplosphaeria fusca]|uniref:Uncharacterized protein n=1 Tax=Polyplosphaeria fusca TaxID=682080 RepID=A0A9P4QQK6_9PLEO|nr:hypothetical protein EJ04DRAFT_555137 [Polyplosphaeria fusca]
MMLLICAFAFLVSYIKAAALSPAGILVQRQDESSSSTSKFTPSVMGYSFAGTEGKSTTWAPYEYDGREEFMMSSGDFYRMCYYTISYSTIDSTSYTAYTISSACPLYTTCSLGVMLAETTTLQCAGNGYQCETWLLYDSWGGSDAMTAYFCPSSTTNLTLTTYYKEKPDSIISTEAPSTTPSSSDSLSLIPAGAPSTSTVSATSSSMPSSPPAHSNNAGVIAGATIGGIAVLGAIGVAVLFILKRSKRHEHHPMQPSPYPMYQSEKPEDPGMAPEYNPHTSALYSAGTGSPDLHSHGSVPGYPANFERGEHSGLRSPTVGNVPMGTPRLATSDYQ